MWMRSRRVVRASGCQCESRISPGSIPASSDTVESEGRQMKQCWITYIKEKTKSPFQKIVGSIINVNSYPFLLPPSLAPAVRYWAPWPPQFSLQVCRFTRSLPAHPIPLPCPLTNISSSPVITVNYASDIFNPFSPIILENLFYLSKAM